MPGGGGARRVWTRAADHIPSVAVSPRCQTGAPTTTSILTVLEARGPRSKSWLMWLLGRCGFPVHSRLVDSHLLAVSSQGKERERKPFCVFLMRHRSHHGGLTLTYLLLTPSHWGLQSPRMTVQGAQTCTSQEHSAVCPLPQLLCSDQSLRGPPHPCPPYPLPPHAAVPGRCTASPGSLLPLPGSDSLSDLASSAATLKCA